MIRNMKVVYALSFGTDSKERAFETFSLLTKPYVLIENEQYDIIKIDRKQCYYYIA